MANNTTKKVTTKPVTEETMAPKKIEHEYAPDDNIKCVSVCAGELIMVGKKTGMLYKWFNYGDTAYVEYQDLKAEAHSSASPIIYAPLIMIEDEDLLETREFARAKEIYKDAITADEIDNFFNLTNQQFKSQLKRLPKGIQNTIKAVAVDKINNGALDSIQKIKILDEVLGTDLYNLL